MLLLVLIVHVVAVDNTAIEVCIPHLLHFLQLFELLLWPKEVGTDTRLIHCSAEVAALIVVVEVGVGRYGALAPLAIKVTHILFPCVVLHMLLEKCRRLLWRFN